jgi:hypothetical protein
MPALASAAEDASMGPLEIPPGAHPQAIWSVLATGRAPKRAAVAGRHLYRIAGLEEAISDDVPRGAGLVSLLRLGVRTGAVEEHPFSVDTSRYPPMWELVENAGGRGVLLEDPSEPGGLAVSPVDTASVARARAALRASPGLVVLRVQRYDEAIDALLLELLNVPGEPPRVLFVALGGEGAARMPWILVSAPVHEETAISGASWIDVFPTALAALGLPVPPDVRGRPLGIEAPVEG